MTESLYIIVDVSGSMKEMGKIHLQRNLCRYAVQLKHLSYEKYTGTDIRFYQWAERVCKVDMHSDGDIPALKAEGSSRMSVLADFLSQQMNDTRSTRFLILSDGNFEHDDCKLFLEWKKENKPPLLRAVAVGADANLFELKKISTNNTVYLSENIASAIDGTVFGSDESLTAPVSTSQILQYEPAATEESEEDWDG